MIIGDYHVFPCAACGDVKKVKATSPDWKVQDTELVFYERHRDCEVLERDIFRGLDALLYREEYRIVDSSPWGEIHRHITAYGKKALNFLRTARQMVTYQPIWGDVGRIQHSIHEQMKKGA